MSTPPAARPVSRRRLLVAAALTGAGLLGGCAPGEELPEGPDPLQALADRARTDSALAEAVVTRHPHLAPAVSPVAGDRRVHADVLTAEIHRVRPPTSTPATSAGPTAGPTSGLAFGATVPPGPAAAEQAVADALAAAQAQAAGLVAGLPRYRAGLVGSVAACCAAHQAVLEVSAISTAAVGRTLDEPPDDGAVRALQAALATEHAAVWTSGVLTAFLPAALSEEVGEGAAAHRARRDTVERMLRDAGVVPVPAEPAYAAPRPVVDAGSALALAVVAETDVAAAWRGVLERTDDRRVRGLALDGLMDAAVRAARWRARAGLTPVVPTFPGTPT